MDFLRFFFKNICNFAAKMTETSMKKTFLGVVSTLIAALVGCGAPVKRPAETDMIAGQQNLPGDSTVYGLACDGCTDTVIVLLPYSGADPDTFHILEAVRGHQLFGHPQIGDRLALLRNRQDTCVADIVIDIDQLTGQWCYEVTPRLRRWAGMSQTEQQAPPPLPDSILSRLLQPRELGFQLNGDFTARPVGTVPRAKSSDERSPVEYPRQKLYHEWRIANGRLLLSETTLDSLGNIVVTGCDTARLVMLRRDSLVLRINDTEQGYYRKKDQQPTANSHD